MMLAQWMTNAEKGRFSFDNCQGKETRNTYF